ncbi:MAG: hypothetical protein Q8916_01465 [Bacteroidota bacterium]|nr:hypothetical protein [Bacteroidota bacterium]MDP4229054.1 hypothetical protein [Bacteroidota bacterium]MDP4235424.1 hypothetical protein [Bacteroidota bacterium]
MKKAFSLFLLSTIGQGLFQIGTAVGQSNWMIQSFSLQIPVIEFDSTYEWGHSFYGSSSVSHTLIDFSQIGFGTGTRSRDSFFIEGHYTTLGATHVEHSVGMNFILDLPSKELKDFHIDEHAYYSYTSNSIHPPYTDNISGSESSVVEFTSLPFSVVNNDTIVIKVWGKQCKDGVKKANYNNSSVDNYANGVYQSGLIDYTIQLDVDTSSYLCSFIFALSEPINSVITSTIPQALSIASSLSDHKIEFTFPVLDHSQMLYAYDILGREVRSIEIPSGVSKYKLPQGQFPKGCYYARIGNMTAKFLVN